MKRPGWWCGTGGGPAAGPRLRLEALEGREVPAVVGAIDPTFGSGGRTTSDLGAGLDRPNAIAVQPDGKIVVVGTDEAGDFVVARFNPNGTPDSTFGGGDGVATFSLGGNEVANAVALQPDGKIVVAGATDAAGNNDMAVIRVLPNGSGLDPAFDSDGVATVAYDIGGKLDDAATAVAVQPDGRIVLAGYDQFGATDYDMAIARLHADGSPDLGFGSQGQTFVFFDMGGGLEDKASAVVIQGDGKIVVVGSVQVSATDFDFGLARVSGQDGTDDFLFGNNGQMTVPFNLGGANDDRATDVALQPDGAFIVVGSVQTSPTGFDVGVARVTPFGATLDPAFNGDGMLTLGYNQVTGTAGRRSSVAIGPNGKIIVAGSGDDFLVTRINPADGSIDTTFGTGGTTAVDVGGPDAAAAMALQANGRIVVAGTSGATGDLALARVIGTIEEARGLAVSGLPDGNAQKFDPAFPNGTLASGGTAVGFGAFTGVNTRVATGDVNGDFVADTILVSGPGAPILLTVISGADNNTIAGPLDPFGDGFVGGGFVAAGDLDNDGRVEVVVTPDQGGGPRVVIFSLQPDGTFAQRASFFGINDPLFRGGARAAVGDVNGDAIADVAVAAGFGGGPRVALFNGRAVFTNRGRLLSDFFVFSDVLRNGVYLAIGDVTGDGFGDLVVGAGPGGGPRVLVVSGQQLLARGAGAVANPFANFFALGDTAERGGVRVATLDADGDNRAEVAVGTGEGSASLVRVYPGSAFGGAGEPATFQDLDPFGSPVLTDGTFVG